MADPFSFESSLSDADSPIYPPRLSATSAKVSLAVPPPRE
jgi:hypothetical protein